MRSSLEYANVVWDGCSESDSNLLVSLQIEGARVVTGALKGTNRVSLLKDHSWLELSVNLRRTRKKKSESQMGILDMLKVTARCC